MRSVSYLNITVFCLGLFILSVSLSGCETLGNYEDYLAKRTLTKSDGRSVSHCHGYGCKFIKNYELSLDEWARIDAYFEPPSTSAAEERDRLEQAIAEFERIIGPKAGTDGDIKDTFYRFGSGQLDCVDESTNTTVYMSALQERGHLKFHTISAPDVSIPIIHSRRWPHQTAVIIDNETGDKYAVDSWFRDNGEQTDVVPLDTWKDGWSPRWEKEGR